MRRKLTTDRQRVMDAYATARDTEDGWPEWELLWEQHPVSEWLNDRVLASFRRHEAPLVEVGAGLDPGALALVFQSTLSNQRSQPVVVDWSAVVRDPGGALARVPFLDLARRAGLHGPLANSGRTLDPAPVQAVLPEAVRRVRAHLDALRQDYEHQAVEALRPEVRHLRDWRARSKDRLTHEEEAMQIQRTDRVRQIAREREEIDRVWEARKRWIEESFRCSPTPYVRLAAVLVRPG